MDLPTVQSTIQLPILSNDIWNIILKYIYSDDIPNLKLSCKKFYGFARYALIADKFYISTINDIYKFKSIFRRQFIHIIESNNNPILPRFNIVKHNSPELGKLWYAMYIK